MDFFLPEGLTSNVCDTKTVSSFSTFFLAMLQYPDIQVKAQAQLDEVMGGNQLPTFDDEPLLPYITAIAKEVLRWQPAGPLGIPHLNTEEDNYKGYTIPAGSVIIANIWYVFEAKISGS